MDAEIILNHEKYCELWKEISKLYEEYAKTFGLSYTNLQVLNSIYAAKNGCTQKQVIEQTLLPKQTVNAAVTGFWKQGYVELTELREDRRVKTIRLTETGKQYADGIVPKIENAGAKAMEMLTPEQRSALIETTCLMRDALQKSMKESEAGLHE